MLGIVSVLEVLVEIVIVNYKRKLFFLLGRIISELIKFIFTFRWILHVPGDREKNLKIS